MPMRLPRILSAVPQTWNVRLEIAKAVQTLVGEQGHVWHRGAELVTIEGELDELRKELRKAICEYTFAIHAELRKYNADEPRVPAGNRDGGQWTTNGGVGPTTQVERPLGPAVRLAGLRCEGFSAGCQSGGSYGTNAMYRISGRNLCTDCAIKMLGIQDEPASEKVLTLTPFSLKR